jgi:site-specific DNA recombinase
MSGQTQQKAVGYVRVSGKGQVNGTGHDRQEESIRTYATQAGVTISKVYKETYTGTESDRPVYAQMLHDLLAAGQTTIIVESLDRFARDLTVQLQLTAHLASRGLTLISASTGQDVTAAMQSDPMMRAMVQIQGVFAELDKSLLVQKLKRARQLTKRRTGRCEGRKPFGTRPGESAIVERMRALSRKPPGGDGLGPYEIAVRLNQEGLPSRTGKPWSGPVVHRILARL